VFLTNKLNEFTRAKNSNHFKYPWLLRKTNELGYFVKPLSIDELYEEYSRTQTRTNVANEISAYLNLE
jgi:hypothetical protein